MTSCKHITCKADGRRTICDKQKISIINWYKKGWSIIRIAKKFNHSNSGVRRIVVPSYRKNNNLKANQRTKLKYSTDKIFRKKAIKASRVIMNKRYRDDPVYRKCIIEQSMERYWKNKHEKS